MRQERPSAGDLLPLSGAAARLRIRSTDLRRAAEAGELPYVRVGDALLFDVDTVRGVLLERAAPPQPAQAEGVRP